MRRLDLTQPVLLGFLALFCGCATEDRRGTLSTCEVHHLQMRSVTIPLVVGWVDHFSEDYSRANRSVFPNAYPEGPASKWKRERIYVCQRCVDARQNWLESHKSAF